MKRARPTLAFVLHAALGGCLISTTASDGGESSEGDETSTTSSSTTTTSASTTSPSETSESSGTSTSTGFDTCGFLDMCEDTGPPQPPYTCDLWADAPCGDGYKCAPWANDGGWVWNTELCTPLADRPRAVGEPCQLGATPGMGIDDCVEGAVCLWADARTGVGTCVELCRGTADAPTCASAGTVCELAFELVPLCLPSCDPLAPVCPDGGACQPVAEGFACIDVLGPGTAPGEPCELDWACAAGSLCIAAAELSACASTRGCCSEICDPMLPEPCGPDRVCTPLADGSNAGHCT